MSLVKLCGKEDLARLTTGDIVKFGFYEEKCLVHNYIGITPEELFLIGRFPDTGIPGGMGIVFEKKDNLRVDTGRLNLDISNSPRFSESEMQQLIDKGYSSEQIGQMMIDMLPRTVDNIFHYGLTLIVKDAKDPRDKEYENPVKFEEFDTILRNAGM
jgi:hypothetical protein